MPKSMEEAVGQGLRIGVRNFIAKIFTYAAMFVAGGLALIILFWLGGYLLERVWDGFTNPITGAFEWVGDKAGGMKDTITGWFPGGGDTVDAVTNAVEEVVNEVPAAESTETSTEPGPICSRWSKLNPFCD